LFEEIQQAAAKGEAVNALCQMTGLSRAGFYRWHVPRQAMPVEMELRDQMQKVALESLAYGYRRITHGLQQRCFEVNHKRGRRSHGVDGATQPIHQLMLIAMGTHQIRQIFRNSISTPDIEYGGPGLQPFRPVPHDLRTDGSRPGTRKRLRIGFITV